MSDATISDETPAPPRRRVSFVRWTIGIILLVPLVIAWAAFMRGDLQSYKVISRSMAPTLEVNDYVLMRGESRYGDLRQRIIAFEGEDPMAPGLVKRVIGEDGDLVELRDGTLYINGEKEDPVREPIQVKDKSWKVGSREVFVVGDNRNLSEDSIEHGPVPRKKIRGVLTFRYWPLSRMGSVQ